MWGARASWRSAFGDGDVWVRRTVEKSAVEMGGPSEVSRTGVECEVELEK